MLCYAVMLYYAYFTIRHAGKANLGTFLMTWYCSGAVNMTESLC